MRPLLKVYAALVLIVTLSLSLSACSGRVFQIDGAGRAPVETRYVGQETLDLIQPEETTSEWVLSMMGNPTTIESIYGTPRKVWRYEYELVEQRDGRTYRILPDRPQGRIARAIHMEIQAGYVQRMWVE